MGLRDFAGRIDAALTRYAASQHRDVFVRQGIDPGSLVGPAWSGLRVDQATASRMIAIHAAWDLIASGVGLIPWGAFEKQGATRIELPEPEWMYQPAPDDPSLTWDEHVSQLAVSLASDGNSFTMVLPEVTNCAELRVLDPERVEVRRKGSEPRYHLTLEGGGREVLGPDQIIHVSRLRRPGQLRGLSPIDEAAQSLGKIRAADRLGARVFDNAVLLSGFVSVPGALSPEAHDLLKDQIKKQYSGGGNAGEPGIFANGAEWKVPMPNLEAMQLLAVLEWGVLDVARIHHIPPRKLGVVSPGAMSYASVEQTAIEWVVDGLRPYITRIENAYRRLLPGRESYVRANVEGLLRGDFKTRMDGMVAALNSHQLLVDEARALEERPPLSSIPDEILFGPGGLLDTPNAPTRQPTAAPATREVPEVVPEVRATRDAEDAPPVTVHNHIWDQRTAEPVTVHNHIWDRVDAADEQAQAEQRAAEVTTRLRVADAVEDLVAELRVREPMPAPIVNVTTPEVRVAAPEVTVNPVLTQPAPAAPVVNVTVPDTQTVHIASLPPMKAKVKRDRAGRIDSIEE